jgi:hypothetical protein
MFLTPPEGGVANPLQTTAVELNRREAQRAFYRKRILHLQERQVLELG